MDWSKLDPDTVVTVLGFLGTVAMYLWNKARGKTTETFRETIAKAFDSMVTELLGKYSGEDVAEYLKTGRKYISERLTEVMTKRNIPRNPLTERLVNEAMEAATAKLGNEIIARKIPAQWDNLVKAIDTITFKPTSKFPFGEPKGSEE